MSLPSCDFTWNTLLGCLVYLRQLERRNASTSFDLSDFASSCSPCVDYIPPHVNVVVWAWSWFVFVTDVFCVLVYLARLCWLFSLCNLIGSVIVNVKFQLIWSKHSWFRSLRLLSEVGSHERTLIRNGGLHVKMELTDPKCELEMPATNPFAYRDRRRRTDWHFSGCKAVHILL